MRESLEKLFLGAIFIYLRERVPAGISSVTEEECLRLYSSYVNFHRERYAFMIQVNGCLAMVRSFPIDFREESTVVTVDLQHPDSLQMVFEFVMSKRWK